MDARQIESGISAVELSGQSFFSKGIYDSRFVSSDYHLFCPDHSLSDSAPLEFTLPPLRLVYLHFSLWKKWNNYLLNFRSKAIYRVNQMVMSCNVKLLLSNGNKIPNNKETAIANDFMNCLWSSSSIFLNNVPGYIFIFCSFLAHFLAWVLLRKKAARSVLYFKVCKFCNIITKTTKNEAKNEWMTA